MMIHVRMVIVPTKVVMVMTIVYIVTIIPLVDGVYYTRKVYHPH